VSDYRWLSPEEIGKMDWQQQTDHQERGYILEVDLSYPPELHDAHSNFPLAPETLNITEGILRSVSLQSLAQVTRREPSKLTHRAQKLTASFLPKQHYIIHYRALKLYLELGMKLTAVHKVLSFRQTSFIAKYIKRTAKLRAEVSNSFWKSAIKLMSNAIFGKMLQSARNYIKVCFCRSKNTLQKRIGSPFFKAFKIYSEGLVAVFLGTEEIEIKQPIAVGLSILEHSKVHMYDMYYNHIVPAVGGFDKLDLLATDTDSFILCVKGTREEFFKNISKIMDFSNFPPTHELYNVARKGELGYFKDEMKGATEISAATCIRSKCYSLSLKSIADGKSTHNRCKGTPKLQRNALTFDDYKNVLLCDSSKTTEITRIQARDHIVHTVKQKRLIFSSFDDKRFYTCLFHSIPYGDYRIKQFMSDGDCTICNAVMSRMDDY
jgi:hypothetical protein